MNRSRKKPHKEKDDTPMFILPTATILATMNIMLEELSARGIKVVNWDDRSKALYGVQLIGSKCVFLTEDITNGIES